jgi:predicted membrane channel-forming protein YqfA (hemolysin III family)
MERAYDLKMFFTMLAENLPVLLVCLVACVVIPIRWRDGSKGSLWAALGFGLALILCFVIPFTYTALHQWAFQSGQYQSRMWVFTAYAIVTSVLRAIIYLCLLVAVFAGRPKTGAG